MIVSNVNNGKKAGYSTSGTKITIEGDVTIDLQQRQRDVEEVIDICLDNNLETMREAKGAWNVATIVIPSRSYETVNSDETDEDGNEMVEVQPLDLNMSDVELRLWALPAKYFEETTEGDEL